MQMKKKLLQTVIEQNYPQIVLVFTAFFVMILVGSFFIDQILRDRLIKRAEENLFTAEANIKAGFSEVEVTLLNSYYVVKNMIEEGESREAILNYLRTTTAWMRQKDGALLGSYGIYGYIQGEFIDGIDIYPDSSYMPQERSWFKVALQSGADIGYTAPYMDWRTKDTIISAVKGINSPDGNFFGVLSVDINITRFKNYLRSLKLASSGYGILINQNMILMAHPQEERLGQQFWDLGKSFQDISTALRANQKIYSKSITDSDGSHSIAFFQRMFNNWYVGLIVPYNYFYKDLYYATSILALLGFFLSLLLSYMLFRISVARIKSDEENKAKSTFLARISHEIRTPMNMILGNSELALREDISPKVNEFLSRIKQAGESLLCLINDIIDFTKAESGKLDIVPVEYEFSSLINDCISSIRPRFTDKSVHFITQIDSSIPKRLLGDNIRLRQILLNLLSNAVKYTNEGYITLKAGIVRQSPDSPETSRGSASPETCSTGALKEGDTVLLVFEVIDTGTGIKEEDMGKLFGDFSRLDETNRYSIAGAGLGLVITKNLCHLMGGEVVVKSRYGTGSVFRASLPQKILDGRPFATVKNPESKNVLVYESRREFQESISYSVINLGLRCDVAGDHSSFAASLEKDNFDFVLAASGLFDDARNCIAGSSRPGAKGRNEDYKTTLVLLADYHETVVKNDACTIHLPLTPVVLAKLFNGETEGLCYKKGEKTALTHFIIPGAKILIVDDISTNLVIAKALLSPYQAQLDTCLSGNEAVTLAGDNQYDIIFMDHMMPGMDGIEAAAAIRALPGSYAKNVPIVALTANAVAGMREMFLSKGFDDYLTKPIDITRMNEIIAKWIPDEKKFQCGTSNASGASSEAAFPEITGVNTKKGIAMTGSSEAGYRNVLGFYVRDVEERLLFLKNIPTEDTLCLFTTQVHALKSASATIGAESLSKIAAELEAAGKKHDMDIIAQKLPGFCTGLKNVIESIRNVILKDNRNTNDNKESISSHPPRPKNLQYVLK
jgi:signal transduction histidine kinase/CheY-like chemotaxis protein/HPt (histidine-containing phosphotransfer) domain-containing protein